MAEILKLTWDTFNHHVENIATKIQQSGKHYDCIIGIPRGGLVPAVLLSHILDIPMASTNAIVEDDFSINHRALLVDDIADTGGTLKRFPKYIDTATICCRMSLENKPTFSSFGVNEGIWIMFPYERNINDPVSEITYKDYHNEARSNIRY